MQSTASVLLKKSILKPSGEIRIMYNKLRKKKKG